MIVFIDLFTSNNLYPVPYRENAKKLIDHSNHSNDFSQKYLNNSSKLSVREGSTSLASALACRLNYKGRTTRESEHISNPTPNLRANLGA